MFLTKEAESLFNDPNKPKGKDVLVVITDANPTGSDLEEKRASFALQDKGVKIITVVMGTDVDPRELQKVTAFKENSLVDDSNNSPTQLGERIVKTAVTGKFVSFLLFIIINLLFLLFINY